MYIRIEQKHISILMLIRRSSDNCRALYCKTGCTMVHTRMSDFSPKVITRFEKLSTFSHFPLTFRLVSIYKREHRLGACRFILLYIL